jgi:alpha-D-xyloside xylohydrolase
MREEAASREVYLPGHGKWIDYQTGKTYASGWQNIEHGQLPIVILIKDGSAIPEVPVAQSTDQIDWKKLEWKQYKADQTETTGFRFVPGDQEVQTMHF